MNVMSITTTILTIAFIALCVFALIKLISAPMKLIFKLLINMMTGFLLLIVAEFICGFFDFSIGITAVNCFIAGFLGIPGVILLVLIKILL